MVTLVLKKRKEKHPKRIVCELCWIEVSMARSRGEPGVPGAVPAAAAAAVVQCVVV
jgi:hypothetical protein